MYIESTKPVFSIVNIGLTRFTLLITFIETAKLLALSPLSFQIRFKKI